MNCEIEFLAVGDASRAGDAIVVRYGEEDAYQLMLIDGGHAETGDKIVAHLKRYFGNAPVLEHVLLTHSDGDHASGLRTVLREIKVNNLWLHVPWLLAEESRNLNLFSNKSLTTGGLRNRIKGEYDILAEIFDLATLAGVSMAYPFQGGRIGPFHILSPGRQAYRYLLPQFDKTPDADQAVIEAAGMWLGKESLTKKLIEAAKAKLQSWTTENWATERLRDGGITSASNESSVVLYGDFGNDHRVLLTGDAGVNGLSWAANQAAAIGLPLQQFSFVQIPHHGSRRNVGPSILNHILGPIQPEGTKRFFAYVSAPSDDEQHPRNIVMNAFKRRGGNLRATKGTNKVHWGGFAPRPGYTASEEVPFYTRVEEYT